MIETALPVPVDLRQTPVAIEHQRSASSNQAANLRAQPRIGMPAVGNGSATKYLRRHLTQRGAGQAGVERLQGLHFQQGSGARPSKGLAHRCGHGRGGQFVQHCCQGAQRISGFAAGAHGDNQRVAMLQAGCDAEPDPTTWESRQHAQTAAIVDQALTAGDAPDIKRRSIRHRIKVRIQLDESWLIGQPNGMRIASVQLWVLQHTQSPAIASHTLAQTVGPVTPVVRVPAQILLLTELRFYEQPRLHETGKLRIRFCASVQSHKAVLQQNRKSTKAALRISAKAQTHKYASAV